MNLEHLSNVTVAMYAITLEGNLLIDKEFLDMGILPEDEIETVTKKLEMLNVFKETLFTECALVKLPELVKEIERLQKDSNCPHFEELTTLKNDIIQLAEDTHN